MDTYPPEPWNLTGHGCVSVWLVPARSLPALPPQVRPVTVLGKALVATAYVDYLPSGLLPYHELLVGVVVREGLRFGLTITHIWVDSPASLAGGRELWGIPKELADFDMSHEPLFSATTTLGAETVAKARMRAGGKGIRMPLPIKGTVFQTLGPDLARTPVTASGHVRPATASWKFSGPLAWLRPHRPLLSIAARDFAMRFGPRLPLGR